MIGPSGLACSRPKRAFQVAAARRVDVDHGRLQVGDRDRASLEREPADAPRPELRAQAAVLDEHLACALAERREPSKIIERYVAHVEGDAKFAAAVAERKLVQRPVDMHHAIDCRALDERRLEPRDRPRFQPAIGQHRAHEGRIHALERGVRPQYRRSRTARVAEFERPLRARLRVLE